MNAGESINVQRTSEFVFGGIDDDQRKLYLPSGSDVRAGDTLGFRSKVRRVVADPVEWRSPFSGWAAGMVVEFEEGPAYLPDLGRLLRPSTDPPVLNEETGTLDPPGPVQQWSGACKVEPTESDGSTPFIGQQAVGKVPFVITVPLTVVDVAPGDLFDVTSSRDTRLSSRLLVITGVRASSTSLDRELIGFDPQD